MKNTQKLITIILALVLCLGIFAACGDEESNAPAALSADDFVFKTDNGSLTLNTTFDPDSFGQYSYYEANSCGYVGLDKIYTYDTFEVYTYPDGEKDYILYIDLFEDSKTARDISIGSSMDDMVKAYGEDYEKTGINYVYKLGDFELSFKIKDEVITEIEYAYAESK